MLITMSDKEIQRLAVLQDVRDHRITKSVLLKSLIFQPVKLPGYYRSSIKMVFQVCRMPVVVNRAIIAMTIY